MEKKDLHQLTVATISQSVLVPLNYYCYTHLNSLYALSHGLEFMLLVSAIPLVACALCWMGKERKGLVLMLGCLPAFFALNVHTWLFLPTWPPQVQPDAFWSFGSHASFVLILFAEGIGIVLTYLSLRKLQTAQSATVQE